MLLELVSGVYNLPSSVSMILCALGFATSPPDRREEGIELRPLELAWKILCAASEMSVFGVGLGRMSIGIAGITGESVTEDIDSLPSSVLMCSREFRRIRRGGGFNAFFLGLSRMATLVSSLVFIGVIWSGFAMQALV